VADQDKDELIRTLAMTLINVRPGYRGAFCWCPRENGFEPDRLHMGVCHAARAAIEKAGELPELAALARVLKREVSRG
jgi:hypothetical protein